MKPYGYYLGFCRDEDYGPKSKYAKLTSKNRRTSRRLLHKLARASAKREIRKLRDG